MPATGTMDMVNGATVDLGSGDAGRASVISVQLVGSWSGTLTIKATVDGTNYVSVFGLAADSTTAATTIASGYVGITRIDATGYLNVRVVGTAGGTGTPAVWKRPTIG